jgi:hypothetical protein
VVLKKEQREEQVYAMRLARSDGRTGPDLRRSPEGCLESPPPRTTAKSSTGSAPEYSGWCAANPSPNGVPTVEAAQGNLPAIFAAVEEQLGFKLERNARGVVEYVSIAAAHPPTEN